MLQMVSHSNATFLFECWHHENKIHVVKRGLAYFHGKDLDSELRAHV